MADLDRRRGVEVGAIMNFHGSQSSFTNFPKRYTPARAAPPWTENLKKALAGQLLADTTYTNEASAHIIHRFGLRRVWMATAPALVLCGWGYRRWGREEARQ